MNKEIDIAFALLRCSLEGRDTASSLDVSMSAQNWWSLFRLLQRNHVAALVSEVFDKMPKEMLPPRAVLIPWLAERDKATDWTRYQRDVQDDIVDTLQKHGIQTLVLKGTHIATYYPHPELREFGDLDLYFFDKHDEADRVAKKELGVSISDKSHHHTKYDYRGVTVESHYDFVNTHYPPSNRNYETLLKEQVPSPTFEVLFLLRHMACHFAASRITLRDLVDWALTCQTLGDKVEWTLVNKTIEDYGMTEFVAVLNAIATQHLGVSMSQCLAVLQSYSLNVSLVHKVEHDLVYGSEEADNKADGLERLGWKLRRWRALAWKRRMVFNDSPLRLLLTSLTSHIEKPQSILHKQ